MHSWVNHGAKNPLYLFSALMDGQLRNDSGHSNSFHEKHRLLLSTHFSCDILKKYDLGCVEFWLKHFLYPTSIFPVGFVEEQHWIKNPSPWVLQIFFQMNERKFFLGSHLNHNVVWDWMVVVQSENYSKFDMCWYMYIWGLCMYMYI